MSDKAGSVLFVPTVEQLRAAVRLQPPAAPENTPKRDKYTISSFGSPEREPKEAPLSTIAEALVRNEILSGSAPLSLEERWRTLGVSSGSVKSRVLRELHRRGFIRLERKGKNQHVHLFSRAWEYLGLSAPTGEGVGGTTHTFLVKQLAEQFRRRGYDVRIEQEIGPARKRVDLVCYGRHGIIGVEVGLTDPRQELKNLREDLACEILDQLLFISTNPNMIRKVRAAFRRDSGLSVHRNRVRFLYFEEDTP